MNDLPAIPNITGYPVIDTMIRNGIGYLAVALTAAMVAWLNSKGFNAGAVGTFLPYILAMGLVAVAAYIWAAVSKKQSIAATVEHVLEASQTGVVPPEIKALASPAQIAKITAVGK